MWNPNDGDEHSQQQQQQPVVHETDADIDRVCFE